MFLLKNRWGDSTMKSNTKLCRKSVCMKLHKQANTLSYNIEKQSPMALWSSFLRGEEKNAVKTLCMRLGKRI